MQQNNNKEVLDSEGLSVGKKKKDVFYSYSFILLEPLDFLFFF